MLQDCHYDLKLPRKYMCDVQAAGNQTARDFFGSILLNLN